MKLLHLRISFILIVCFITSAAADCSDVQLPVQDTLKESQVLYNGRIWRDLYLRIDGDQFLFTNDFLPGTVAMKGTVFSRVPLRYDVYNDELITQTRHGLHLQLNKEMVDNFILNNGLQEYWFEKADSNRFYNGYVNKLYSGKSTLIVKYLKRIELLAVDNTTDQFYLVTRMFLVRDSNIFPFSGKLELMNLLGDHKKEVKTYLQKNRIKLMKNRPESFVPAIEYYDRIR